jgi:hypothetical protein
LQNTQKFNLQQQRCTVDLIEKDGACVGRFEAACPIVYGARKRASHVAEEFAFQEAFAQGTAIYFDEGTTLPIRKAMHSVGNQFFPCSRFAQYQDRSIATCNSAS